jgi:hypothetical protein
MVSFFRKGVPSNNHVPNLIPLQFIFWNILYRFYIYTHVHWFKIRRKRSFAVVAASRWQFSSLAALSLSSVIALTSAKTFALPGSAKSVSTDARPHAYEWYCGNSTVPYHSSSQTGGNWVIFRGKGGTIIGYLISHVTVRVTNLLYPGLRERPVACCLIDIPFKGYQYFLSLNHDYYYNS